MDFRMSLICAVRKTSGTEASPTTAPPRSVYATPLVKRVTRRTGRGLGDGVLGVRRSAFGVGLAIVLVLVLRLSAFKLRLCACTGGASTARAKSRMCFMGWVSF